MNNRKLRRFSALAAAFALGCSSGAVCSMGTSAAGEMIQSGFESGDDGFTPRGNAKLSNDQNSYYSGNSSLAVTARTDNWNGAAISLAGKNLAPGKGYSFSAAVLQNSGAPVSIKMTLEYGGGFMGGNYDEIAIVTAESGKWTDISNIDYRLPEGAENATLYFEAPESLTDFNIDCFTAAPAGTPSAVTTGGGVVNGSSQTVTPHTDSAVRGDFDGNGSLNAFDLILGRRKIIQKFSGDSNPVPLSVSDVDGNGQFELSDIVLLNTFLLGREKKFPETTTSTTTTTTTVTSSVTTSTGTTTVPGPHSGGDLMKSISGDMQINAPAGFAQNRGGVDYGKSDVVTYQSKDGKCEKKMTVILPPGYNENEKYPVLYVLHGIGGDHTSMPGMGVQTMLGNLIADGEAEKMIIVCPSMLTGQGFGFGFDQETMRKYDLIREDIENSIMPYMEEHYSVKTGRENTAITGFSLGGREALYCGITHSQNYGYVGSACAAPGIFPTQDMYMVHEGSLKQESEFKPPVMPELILISAAQNDGVVGVYPESYHKALENNGVEHLWQIIPQGDHGGATVTPHMYNFLRYVFK